MSDALMTSAELGRELEARDALVVHFSHHANMREGGVFPEDLLAAIENRHKWDICCTLVWPGHNLRPVGDIGVIFKPSAEGVVGVSSGDAGTFRSQDGRTAASAVQRLTHAAFAETFATQLVPYNEWIITRADPIGIYVAYSQGPKLRGRGPYPEWMASSSRQSKSRSTKLRRPFLTCRS